MPVLIGMDEAGYGPNLGPLVITVTAWEMQEDPHGCDLFELLANAVTRTASGAHSRLHVGDSKQVYSSAKGLKSLELPVLAILKAAGVGTTTFHALWRAVAVEFPTAEAQEPWFADDDFTLPVECDGELVDRLATKLGDALDACGVDRPQLACEVVLTDRFNHLTATHGTKGAMLSRLSLALLRRLWCPDGEATFVVCDKHGGRNRYDELLAEVLDGQMIFRIEEGRQRSQYRIGQSAVRFQTKAEEHFPVAVASMVSKYLRELAMLAFNRYWQRQLPDIRPTKGYPTDARRFRHEIAAKQAELGIADEVLWRAR